MGFIERWRRFVGAETEERELVWPWMDSALVSNYGLGLQQTWVGREEKIAPGYAGLVNGTIRSNGVVFACIGVRARVFSEARFQWQRLRNGRPAELYSTPELGLLEKPWPGGTTGDLLARSLVSADLAGNAFIAKTKAGHLQVLRPDWVTIVSGLSNIDDSDGWDLGAVVIGYLYQPGGPGKGRDAIGLFPNEVAHFAPMPDPVAPWRGMSWLTPVIREVMGDSAATTHKLQFFENGATPNMVVKGDPTLTPEKFKEWVKLFREGHEGTANAYKTIFLGGGADATVVGANLRQLDFKTTQGAGETRIAAAAGVPPVLVGLSEGLQAATYSNYGQARRAFGDEWARPNWRNFAGSLESIAPPLAGSRLWYDDRDVPFLQEDQKDAAEILASHAATIRALVDAGFKPDSVVKAVDADDITLLQHTDLFSVQLQPPGTVAPPEPAASNGKAPADAVAPGQ
jgi:phage portal protein BeeE